MSEITDLQPPLPNVSGTAGELTTLVEFLDYFRAVLARKASGLSSEQLAATITASDLSIGGLVYHMAMVEDSWFHMRFEGNDKAEPWASAPWEDDWDWEFHHPATLTPEAILTQYDTSIARSRAVVTNADSLDDLAAATKDPTNLRWIMVHMIEEYARHCGHADLIRQAIDGVVDD